jgi:preprotein translocase SecF subunit
MKITQRYKLWFLISGLIILVGIGGLFIKGFNLGIDFSGGTMIQVEMGKMYEVKQIKEDIAAFDLDPQILHVGADKSSIIIRTKDVVSSDERREVFNVLKTKYALNENALVAAELFGPAIGAEISRKAALSIALASLGILIYVSMRFEWRFGVASIMAILHDVLIVMTVYIVFQIPVNSAFIAAILTVVGYSINDTIVIFDRIREDIKTTKRRDMMELANDAVNETLARSINTSLTTVLVIFALYVFGVTAIKDLALPLMVGILTGAYSSITIASPIWVLLKQHSNRHA